MTTDSFVAYIGIDWADRKHDIALYDCSNSKFLEAETLDLSFKSSLLEEL
jgi:hypothetical protein